MNERAAWDQEIARKYDLDRNRDRVFFDQIWQDADELEESFTYFEEFEGFAEYRLRYYSMPAPGDDSSSVSSNMKDARNGGDGNGGRESNGDGGGVALDERTAALAAAWGEYLAATAATDQRVMRLRERICGGPTRTLTSDKALEFLEANSVQDGRKVFKEAPDTLLWPDGSGRGRGFRFEEGSVLEDLQDAAEYLAKHYPWSAAQAVRFIVCGDKPQPMVLGVGSKSATSKGPPAHRRNQTTITMEVAAWMPAEYVRRAYCKARESLTDGDPFSLVGARQSPPLRSTEVFRFVLSKARVYFRSREECLARLELLPWAELVERWNAERPKDDPWRYGKLSYFQRDFDRAALAITDTYDGLPGVPGQPKTKAELKELGRQMEEEREQGLFRFGAKRDNGK